jgi:cysteinyl-tRNA synthetase
MRKIFDGKNKSERIDGTNGADQIFGNGGNDKLIGHGGDDKIYGGDGNDKLFGGRDHDILTGGKGKDQFLFNDVSDATSDEIRDFKHGVDRIGFDVFAFENLQTGVISPDNFVQGSAALDGDDFLIFDNETNQLYYDADGNGEGAQVLIAHIEFKGDAVLTSEDLFGFMPGGGAT